MSKGVGSLNFDMVRRAMELLMIGTVHGVQNGFTHDRFPPALYVVPKVPPGLMCLNSVGCITPPACTFKGSSVWMPLN